MGLSNAQKLTQLNNLRRELNFAISQVGWKVAALRGMGLREVRESRYVDAHSFKKYTSELMNAESGRTWYAGVDYPIDYPIGTRLIEARFEACVGDSYETINVTFPEEYLDDADWMAKEQKLVDRVNAHKSEKDQAAANVERARKMEQLVKLKKELGED